jgi:tRNA (guanine-N7-)-methyltransferase
MGKNKLSKFEENKSFRHFMEPAFEDIRDHGFEWKGKWNEFFGNDNPVTLELACGKGEYSVGLSKLYPKRNFVGMDIKGARLWRGAKTVQDEAISNVAFLRQRISLIPEFFSAEDKVDQIWIIFPDPQPRESKTSKRLTSPEFLARYRKFMNEDGIVHLKTDSDLLFQFTHEVIAQEKLTIVDNCEDIYRFRADDPHLKIQTHYERLWLSLGRTIYYVSFRLGDGPK